MNKNKLYWLCQIGGWLFFVLVEFLGYGSVYGFNELLLLNICVNLMLGITLTHFYRLFFIKSGWLNKPIAVLIPRAIIGVAIVSFLLTAFNIWLDRLTVPLLTQLPLDWVLILNYVFNWSKYILLWALIYHLFQYWERSLEAEKDRYHLQATLKESQFNNLRTQLNPHFLFNSLNGIRTLIDLNPVQAKEAITMLSSLLRSSLQMNKQKTVSVRQEMETVQNYMAIEKIRFEERLLFSFHLDPKSLDMQVPPMMLQTLLENAVKHGISQRKDGGQIVLSTQVINQKLRIEIINSGSFLPEQSDSGYGLENTRERLRLLYEDQAKFQIGNLDSKHVITTIEIPL